MRNVVSVSRMAKSAGLNPSEVVLALIDRGIEIDDPDTPMDPAARKVVRSVIREISGGPAVVRVEAPKSVSTLTISPASRSGTLIGMVSADDVIFIHERLCIDFALGADPIDPPGIRSESLLESAVSRQSAGYGNLLKYHEPVVNAATLLYGLCNDHPFHNGNKRTALVGMLAHLDKNRLCLQSTKQKDLFDLMIAVADHKLMPQIVKVGRDRTQLKRRGTADEEVMAIADWLRPRASPVSRGERSITYRELRQILQSFGFVIGGSKNMKVTVCRTPTKSPMIFKTRRPKHVMTIDWPSDGRTVGVSAMKRIRDTLRLREEDGVPSDTFYSKGVRIDAFINEYRVVLRRLASK